MKSSATIFPGLDSISESPKYEAETLHGRSRRLVVSSNVEASYEILHPSEIDVIPSSVADGK